MRGKNLMWTGLIGFIVGLVALFVCLMLPIALGPNVSWGEALLGIIPSAVLTLVFLVLMFIGMALAVGGDNDARRRRRRHEDDDDVDDDEFDDEFDDEPRRRGRDE